jgi:hypothetical protein
MLGKQLFVVFELPLRGEEGHLRDLICGSDADGHYAIVDGPENPF